MATTALVPTASVSQALTTSYLGASDLYIVRGAGQLSIMLDDASIGFTVKLQPEMTGTAKDAVEYVMPAGAEFWRDISNHASWKLDIKAASGTPSAQISHG